MKGSRLKNITLKDILDVFKFLFIFLIALIFRLVLILSKKSIWLISEEKDEACDNGYHLFKYIRQKEPKINCFYAITKDSKDVEKIKDYGNIIYFNSFKHWLYFLGADLIITTHKHSSPAPALFYVLFKNNFMKNKRVFLQHGITMNKVDYLDYKQTKFRLFICAAKKEYEYVLNNFNYPKENVKLLGFSRFDALEKESISKNILIMPSWRSYIAKNKNIDFEKTLYFKKYQALLNNKKLIEKLEKENIILNFYVHRNMQKYLTSFKTCSKNIKILNKNTSDIQNLLKKASLLITDYSSVSIDFAYMNKPLIYYQFDRKSFFKNHLEKGYFSYEKDGFGPVITLENKLVNEIIKLIDNNYKNEYLKRSDDFFKFKDKDNSKRIYNYLKSLVEVRK